MMSTQCSVFGKETSNNYNTYVNRVKYVAMRFGAHSLYSNCLYNVTRTHARTQEGGMSHHHDLVRLR